MKKKLSLKQLEVKSFITTADAEKLKGGAPATNMCQVYTLNLGCLITGPIICG